jgi:hypothetical protein
VQPHDIIRATSAPLNLVGAAFYFAPDTRAAAKEQFGLDGFRNYFLGRGGVLGDVDADVVAAAFGYFEPGLIRNLWASGVERIAPRTPRDVARAFIAAGHEFGRAHFAGIDGLAEFADAAATVTGSVEPAALPLFAGVRAEPVPTDPPAAALHQAMVLRELRGSVHLVAVVASGLTTAVAHAIKRPADTEMFGYASDAAEAVTAEQRAAWERAEQLTDELLVPAYSGLSDAQGAALVDGARAMHAVLAG